MMGNTLLDLLVLFWRKVSNVPKRLGLPFYFKIVPLSN
jgi:hypothetical protein